MNSRDKTFELTPEYYAVMHYTHFVTAGTKLLYAAGSFERTPVAVFLTPEGKHVVVAGTRDREKEATVSVKFGL